MSSESKPAWLGSRQGISDQVLPPWTPLSVGLTSETADEAGKKRASAIEVGCWGRTYHFGEGIFPDRIKTAGHPLLAAPIRLIAIVNGQRQEWQPGPLSLDAPTAARVSFSQEMEAQDLKVVACTQVEYDGVLRVDWELHPKQAVRLEELTFEIALRPEHARYLYYYPHYERSWAEHKPRALDGGPFADDFRPVLWLGDEERGLMWFCESDQNWISDNASEVTQVRRENAAVVLRLRLVSKPVELRPEEQGPPALTYTFGLLATPVKPIVEDAWDYRTFHVSQGTFGVDTRLKISEADLDRLAGLGVKTIAFHEHWTDIESYTATTYGDDLRRLVAGCHARGIKLLLYFGFLFSDIAPEWAAWSDECLLEPRRGYEPYNYPPQPLQNALIVCYRSVWQDFLVHGIAQVMDEYDVDGVYLDGTATPFGGCSNQRHGCGYIGPDGALHVTYALFPIRETLRRIYAVVKSRKPEGQVNVHQSGFMTPAIPYFTSYWDGEHLFASQEESATERLPLDMFRAEFMGRQWGIPAEFLHYSLGLNFRQALALSLLHDVPVRPMTLPDLEELSRLWKAFDQFGRKEAQFFPYWRNSEYVAVEPEGCYVSLYRSPLHGVLAVVSNLSGREQALRIRFTWPGAGPGRFSVQDALSGQLLTGEDGLLSLSLAHLDWRLLRLPAGWDQ